MSREHEERIFDAALEEVLGGHSPPDLSATILHTLEARRVEAGGPAAVPLGALPIPIAWDATEPLAPPIQPTCDATQEHPAIRAAVRRPAARRAPTAWLSLAIAGCTLLAIVVAGLLVLNTRRTRPGGSIVRAVPQPPEAGDMASASHTPPARDIRIRHVPFAAEPHGRRPSPSDRSLADSRSGSPQNPAPDHEAPPTQSPLPSPHSPSPDAEVIAFVDRTLEQGWRQRSVTPSPSVSDAQWCRRVYRQLIGCEPTSGELERFLRNDADRRRQDLVDQLLASDRYAQHWAGIWSRHLLGAAAATGERSLAEPDGLEQYLREAIRSGRPYDQMARELLVATGSNRPGAEDYNGAVNFLLAGASGHAEAATDRVARVFLGKQLVCTRCHDHPANPWKAGEFWELNAFFRQMRVRRDAQSDAVRLVDADFFGDSGAPKDAEIFYRLPDGQLRIAYPRFDGHPLPHSGLLDDVDRRRELARLLVASDDFPRAVVNRVWAQLLGYGLTRPVDDMGPHNPPSHPELLDRLAGELAAHEFQLDRLIRWIVLSRAFDRSDRRTPESWMDAPEMGGRPLFARYYRRQPATTDVYRGLMTAVNAVPAGTRAAGTMSRVSWIRPAGGVLSIIEPQPAEAIFANGWPNGWLGPLAASPMPTERKIEHLFLSALDRKPSKREMIAAKLVLADRLNDAAALGEIWQTLLAGG